MKITDIRVRKLQGENTTKLKAYVDITLDNELVIHELKVIEGENGLFIAMPSRKMPDNSYKDVVHPITSDLRNEITQAITKAYQEKE